MPSNCENDWIIEQLGYITTPKADAERSIENYWNKSIPSASSIGIVSEADNKIYWFDLDKFRADASDLKERGLIEPFDLKEDLRRENAKLKKLVNILLEKIEE